MIMAARGSAWRTTMVWPRPPRTVPGPPESARYSFCSNTSGLALSRISSDTLRTPLGYEVTDSPSLPGRAPVPPVEKLTALKRGPASSACCSSCVAPASGSPPTRCRFHSDEAPSAGTWSGRAWRSAPNTASGSSWPMMWRAVTAAGKRAFRIEPSGAATSTSDSEPALLGTSAPIRQRMPNEV